MTRSRHSGQDPVANRDDRRLLFLSLVGLVLGAVALVVYVYLH
jgi:hypothetical protein